MKTVHKYGKYLRFNMDVLINDNRKIHYCYRGVLMEISVKQKVMAGITGLWCVIIILFVLGHNVYAGQKRPQDVNEQREVKLESSAKDTNDPNGLWWSKWDTVVNDPNDPNEMLESKWKAVVNVLQNKQMELNLKKKIIDKIISPIFDSELMAMLALGRTNWPKLTASQQKRFTELFAELLKNMYLEKTTLFNNEKVFFKPAVQQKETIQIPMVLISNDSQTAILYKLRKMDEAGRSRMSGYWKIYDVEIEGISILQSYRSQFDDILRRGSVKDLLSQLEKQIAP
jgi:phospholipid transport system substrate-binding protein